MKYFFNKLTNFLSEKLNVQIFRCRNGNPIAIAKEIESVKLSSGLFNGSIDTLGFCTVYGILSTEFSFQDEVDYLESEGEIPEGMLVDLDYDAYTKAAEDVIKEFYESKITPCVQKYGFEGVRFVELNKPREYNFRGDYVYFDLLYNSEKFEGLTVYEKIEKDFDLLEDNLKDSFLRFLEGNQSGPGFINLMPETLTEFVRGLDAEDERVVAQWLDWNMQRDNNFPDLDEATEFVQSNLFVSDCIKFIPEEETV